mmetsp:Transcript_48817/g.153259  ORF Transcript_48817/g.153259 Transcript_48817/m.153259 type:complete len:88 (+) Transcript_48817:1273-1536(+)
MAEESLTSRVKEGLAHLHKSRDSALEKNMYSMDVDYFSSSTSAADYCLSVFISWAKLSSSEEPAPHPERWLQGCLDRRACLSSPIYR